MKETTDPDAVPENVDMAEGSSKIGFVWSLLRKLANVKDIASMRLSLPANLITPISNLEFWNYNDHPATFVSIPLADDPLERMIRVTTWFLAKDIKWKRHELRKPYNPILGEVFLGSWLVERDSLLPNSPELSQSQTLPSQDGDNISVASTAVNSVRSPIRVVCINEQIKHHPAVSSFFYQCQETGVEACGIDHVSAKFTGTAIKVGAGDHNHGVYVTLTKRNEEYCCTYPWASISGFITGRPHITVSETSTIICPKTRLKCVIRYIEEPYFLAPRFAIEGKIFEYDPEADALRSDKERRQPEKYDKIPNSDVVATITGAWNGQIFVQVGDQPSRMLIDIQACETAEKIVRPVEEQQPYESRRVWHDVTQAINAKDFTLATKLKRHIEDEQRKIRAEMESAYEPKFFTFDVPVGPAQADDHHMSRGKPSLRSDVKLSLLF